MEGNVEKEKHTIRLKLYNSLEVEIDFFLEPEGMMLSIPPGEVYDIVVTQALDEELAVQVKQDKEGLIFYCVYSWDSPTVYHGNTQVYP